MSAGRVLVAKPKPATAPPRLAPPTRPTSAGAASHAHATGATSTGAALRRDFSSVPSTASRPIQRKARTRIGAVSDPLEHEADATADRVMRMPERASTSVAPPSATREALLQRKCAACDDEERLQREAAPNAVSEGTAPSIVHDVLRSPGRPLDGATRSFMEPRFGRDFSQIRVHTDGPAAASAASVGARAYTVASHVVFGAGTYAPGTREGRRLLAHELTHTLQQARGGSARAMLQRVPVFPAASTPVEGDFDIVGKSGDTASDTSSIHFQRNSDVVDADEAAKLTAAPSADVTLHAHQSEDEAAGTDAKRAAAVKKALVDKGHDPAKIHVTTVGPERGKIDYRGARIVEVVIGAAPAAKTHCTPGASTAVACKSVGRSAPFRAALPVAIATIEAARAKLKKDAGAGTPTPATLAVVQRHFAKVSNADKVRDKLHAIATFLKGLPPITECHNECDSDCGSPAYWDPGTSKMVLCSGFLSFSDAGKAGLLMHEATHGVPSIQSEDLGYASDRMIGFLDEAHAFKNTDSFTTLVMELTGVAEFADKVPVDTFSGFSTRKVAGVNVPEEDLIKRPLALAEKWSIWANQDLQFLHGTIKTAIGAGRPVAGPDAREVMASAHDRFGLTVATSVPTLADQKAVAALAERFERMSIQTFNQSLTITKAGKTGLGVNKPTAWGAATETPAGGPLIVAGEIAVGEDFFTASDDEARARLIVQALAHAMPDITHAREAAYGLFAFDRSKTTARR